MKRRILLISILCICILAFMPKFFVKAYSGKESADQIDDFDDDYVQQNKFKLWSVYKSMGMSDLEAIAALACVQAECGYRAELVEESGIETREDRYGIHNPPQSNTISARDEYIDKISRNIEDANFRTRQTDDVLLNVYGVDPALIEKAHNNALTEEESHAPTTHGYTVSLNTYYVHGKGYCGCGLYQYTGNSLINLFKWCQNYGCRWFEFEYQLAYTIAPSATLHGFRGEQFDDFIAECKEEEDLNVCVEKFAKKIVNGSMPSSQIQTRQQIAAGLVEEFKGLDWDRVYGSTVLALAGRTPEEERDGIEDKSVFYENGSVVLIYPLNEGFVLPTSLDDKLLTNNQDVLRGYIKSLTENGEDTTNEYGLFELYGEDIHWYRYFGEETYTNKLLDHIWSAVEQGKADQLISFDTIFYDAYNYLSCQVYPNRAHVLSKEEIKNGQYDPRASSIWSGYFTGVDYEIGSLKLTLSKLLIATISFLMGPGIRNFVFDFISKIESDEHIWPVFRLAFLSILSIAMVFFIISMAKKVATYYKGNGSSPRDIFGRFLIGVLCLGLLIASVYNPDKVNPVIQKVVNIVDTLFDEALQEVTSDDEVIKTSNADEVVHSVLWEKAIFRPWCRGQFGLDYEKLYTTYAEAHFDDDYGDIPDYREKVDIMPQSNEDVPTVASIGDDEDGDALTRAYYNSASITGDIYVPVGNNKRIRNWAAYLYSCGSKYHIDSTIDANTANSLIDMIDTEYIRFPHYTLMTTAGNKDLYADTFRVIDAQMDISPQYFANGTIVENYINSHFLEPDWSKAGNEMLFNVLMTVFFIPMIYLKLMSFILLMITLIKLAYFSIVELFKEHSGLNNFWESLKKHFFNYFVASIKLNLMILLYYLLIDIDLIHTILYCICCLVVLAFNYKDAKTAISSGKQRIDHFRNKHGLKLNKQMNN